MGRYTKIILGPARKNDPQVTEAEASAAILPGQFVTLNAQGRFALAVAATTAKVWLAQENYLKLQDVDTAYAAHAAGPPIVRGDIVMGLELDDTVLYAARLAIGQNVTAIGTPLAIGAGGNLVIAGASARIIAHADEIFNNNTGTTQLIRIRPAGSQSYVTGA